MQGAGSNSVNLNQSGLATVNGVSYDFNPNLNTASYVNAFYAPYQGYGNITYFQNIGKSNWNALEMSLRHHTTTNLYLTSAYTWSAGMDNFGVFRIAITWLRLTATTPLTIFRMCLR